MRRYAEPVQVRQVTSGDDALAAAPEEFWWQGRRYVVAEVLGHWREPVPWWDGAAARALRGQAVPDDLADDAATVLVGERRVWRVTATTRRGGAPASGTYELGAAPGQPWSLVRVVD